MGCVCRLHRAARGPRRHNAAARCSPGPDQRVWLARRSSRPGPPRGQDWLGAGTAGLLEAAYTAQCRAALARSLLLSPSPWCWHRKPGLGSCSSLAAGSGSVWTQQASYTPSGTLQSPCAHGAPHVSPLGLAGGAGILPAPEGCSRPLLWAGPVSGRASARVPSVLAHLPCLGSSRRATGAASLWMLGSTPRGQVPPILTPGSP